MLAFVYIKRPFFPTLLADLFLVFMTGITDIPHRGPDFGEFLSVKPFIPLSQELE
jgi:hypothetical protein